MTADPEASRLSFWARVASLVVVWAVAVEAFLVVPTSDHPERAAGFVEAAYRALGLFVLSAEGYPVVDRAHPLNLGVLWTMHFLAPILTTTFVVDAVRQVREAISGPERVAARADGHLVLAGFGKHGRLTLQRFLERHPDEEVVVIDSAPTLPPFVPGPWRNPVPVLRDDVQSDARGALIRAGIERASVLVASTGDDVLNVSVCLTAREIRPAGLRLVAVVHDDGMTNVLRDTLDARGVEVLDTHELAAHRLFERLVADGTFAEPHALVIIGFGTFGQALCHVVLADDPSGARLPGVVLVDVAPDARKAVPPGVERRVSFVPGNAEDPEILAYALRKAEVACGRAIVALCTDDDNANLRVAFALRRRLPEGVVLLARLFRHPPADVEKLLLGSGIRCFELEDLIAERVAELLR